MAFLATLGHAEPTTAKSQSGFHESGFNNSGEGLFDEIRILMAALQRLMIATNMFQTLPS